jgi:uncharacterized pyridoxamine 5'-phosphate oxidase family protein
MKILNAAPGFSSQLSEQETKNFLKNSKLNIHLGTLDEKNRPNIHPVWYHYDDLNNRLYIETSKASKKMSNVKNNKTVYFCIDEPYIPYKGVRGRGKVVIHEEIRFNVSIAEKIMVKYLGDVNHPMAVQLLNHVKNGDSYILEIIPNYYSTWDTSKSV